MAARQPSWRAVAEALAQRLQWHLCAGHAEEECDDSDPWCRNRIIYRRFEQKRKSA
jgi:hypothetical protein